MEEEENKTYESTTSSTTTGSAGSEHRGFKETFRSGSPDEVHDRVKDTVKKGVAAVAGALKGFADGTKEKDVPGTTKSAIHQAGETARSTVSSVTTEAQNLKEPLKEAGQKLSETARDMRSTVKDQYQQTKSAVKDTGSTSTSGMGSTYGAGAIGSTSLPDTEPASMGMGGSQLGSGSERSGEGTQMPDISKTPLSQSDKKLQGKDLTKDYEE